MNFRNGVLSHMMRLSFVHSSLVVMSSEAKDFSAACMFDMSNAAGKPLPATSATHRAACDSFNLNAAR